MERLLVAVLVSTGALPAGDGGPPRPMGDEEWMVLVERVRTQEPEFEGYTPWKKLKLVDPRTLIVAMAPDAAAASDGGVRGAEAPVATAGDDGVRGSRGVGTSQVLASLTGRFGVTYGLSRGAARAFLEARLLMEPEGGWFQVLRPDAAQRALEAHRVALREAPGNLAVVASLVAGVRLLSQTPGYDQAVREAVERSPDPSEIAITLARAQLPYWETEFAELAASREPARLSEVLDALGEGSEEEEASIFYLAAFRAMTSASKASGAPFPRELGERLIRNALRHHRPVLAISLLDAMPSELRELLRKARWLAHENVYESGLQVPGQRAASGDIRPELACALLVMGRRADAESWRAAVQKHPVPLSPSLSEQDRPDPDVVAGEKLTAAVLDWQLPSKKKKADPFDLLLLAGNRFGGGPDVTASILLARALSTRLVDRARDELTMWTRLLEEEARARRRPEQLPRLGEQPFTQKAHGEWKAAQDETLKLVRAELEAMPRSVPADAKPDPISLGIRARLEAPPVQAFVEKALSDAPVTGAGWKAVGKDELTPPRGFWLVRGERAERRVHAVALSHRLDPAGEVSGGGYWLLISEDDGASWKPPVYLGLRQFQPYSVSASSKVPLLDGGVLRLAAMVKELDERSVTFPPIALQPKRESKELLLEAPLESLERDSDQDGLADLVEERLLLDAQDADTDHDGIRDGEDVTPNVPTSRASRGAADVNAELVSALLFQLSGERARPVALVTGIPGNGAKGLDAIGRPVPATLEDVKVLEIDRRLVTRVQFASTTLAFTGEELGLAQKRFGPHFGLSIEVYVNERADQALLVWDERWRGGTFFARKKGRTWVLEDRGSWIT